MYISFLPSTNAKSKQPTWMYLCTTCIMVSVYVKSCPFLELKYSLHWCGITISAFLQFIILITTCRKTIYTSMCLQTLPTEDIFSGHLFLGCTISYKLQKSQKRFLLNAKVFKDDRSFSEIWAINCVTIPTANQSCNNHCPCLCAWYPHQHRTFTNCSIQWHQLHDMQAYTILQLDFTLAS